MIPTEKFIGLCEDVAEVLTEVRGIKADMVDLKAEVSSENSAIRQRVSSLEADVARAKAWVSAVTGGILWLAEHLNLPPK